MVLAYKDIPEELRDYYLTPRETTVAQKLSLGITVKQIAIELKLSTNTIHHHITEMRNRLKSNGYDLVDKVRRMGMLEVEPLKQRKCSVVGEPILNYCQRCGHDWISINGKKPRVCSKCKSAYWDTPKLK